MSKTKYYPCLNKTNEEFIKIVNFVLENPEQRIQFSVKPKGNSTSAWRYATILFTDTNGKLGTLKCRLFNTNTSHIAPTEENGGPLGIYNAVFPRQSVVEHRFGGDVKNIPVGDALCRLYYAINKQAITKLKFSRSPQEFGYTRDHTVDDEGVRTDIEEAKQNVLVTWPSARKAENDWCKSKGWIPGELLCKAYNLKTPVSDEWIEEVNKNLGTDKDKNPAKRFLYRCYPRFIDTKTGKCTCELLAKSWHRDTKVTAYITHDQLKFNKKEAKLSIKLKFYGNMLIYPGEPRGEEMPADDDELDFLVQSAKYSSRPKTQSNNDPVQEDQGYDSDEN
jgi:hypothetical protein